jgi:hypothetical protein
VEAQRQEVPEAELRQVAPQALEQRYRLAHPGIEAGYIYTEVLGRRQLCIGPRDRGLANSPKVGRVESSTKIKIVNFVFCKSCDFYYILI